jgi:hypothetical protein
MSDEMEFIDKREFTEDDIEHFRRAWRDAIMMDIACVYMVPVSTMPQRTTMDHFRDTMKLEMLGTFDDTPSESEEVGPSPLNGAYRLHRLAKECEDWTKNRVFDRPDDLGDILRQPHA